MGRRCGVLGDPIEHSLSPVLHLAGYEALGLDWTYAAHRVASGGLPAFLAGLEDDWRGLSLTMPLKREVVGLVDELSERARLAGAANTVVLDDGRLVGDNTDIPGAIAAIRERTSAPLATAVILGGGATATSIGLALADLGVRDRRGRRTLTRARDRDRRGGARPPRTPRGHGEPARRGDRVRGRPGRLHHPRRGAGPCAWCGPARACPPSSRSSTTRGRRRWPPRSATASWSAASTCSCTRRPCSSSSSPASPPRSVPMRAAGEQALALRMSA